jgi:hypothetical protein
MDKFPEDEQELPWGVYWASEISVPHRGFNSQINEKLLVYISKAFRTLVSHGFCGTPYNMATCPNSPTVSSSIQNTRLL